MVLKRGRKSRGFQPFLGYLAAGFSEVQRSGHSHPVVWMGNALFYVYLHGLHHASKSISNYHCRGCSLASAGLFSQENNNYSAIKWRPFGERFLRFGKANELGAARGGGNESIAVGQYSLFPAQLCKSENRNKGFFRRQNDKGSHLGKPRLPGYWQ